MAQLPAKIASLDEIGEVYKDVYRKMTPKEKGTGPDGFVLDVLRVDNFAMEDVQALRSKASMEKANSAGLKADLAQYKAIAEAHDTDATGMGALLDAAKAGAAGEADSSGLLTSERERHAVAEAKLKDENAKLTGLYERSRVESSIAEAVADAKGNMRLLGPLLAESIKPIRLESGEIVARPVDKNGIPRMTNISGETGDMPVSEFIQELKNDKSMAGAFQGKGVSGTGTTADGTGSTAGASLLDNIPADDIGARLHAASLESKK